LFDKSENLLHHIGATYDLAAIYCATHRPPERSSFFLFAPPLDPRSHRLSDLFVLERLANAAESSMLPGCDCGIKGGIGRYHYDHGIGIHLEELLQGAEAADAGHGNVKQDYVISPPAVRLKSLLACLSQVDAITFRGKKCLQDLPHYLFIVNDEH
jgi:hypothetical protein